MSDLPPLAWHHVIHPAAKDGTLAAYLDTLPRERWTEVGPAGKTLLHYACLGDNVPAALALVKHGLDVEAIDLGHWTPAHTAVYKQAPRVLEVLCALGADLRARTANNDTPIDLAICHYSRTHETGRVLLANGVRLATALDKFRRLVPPELVVVRARRLVLPCGCYRHDPREARGQACGVG